MGLTGSTHVVVYWNPEVDLEISVNNQPDRTSHRMLVGTNTWHNRRPEQPGTSKSNTFGTQTKLWVQVGSVDNEHKTQIVRCPGKVSSECGKWVPEHCLVTWFQWGFLLRDLVCVYCIFVYYESRKWELKTKPICECRCDERLKTKTEKSTRLTYTGLHSVSLLLIDKERVHDRTYLWVSVW
jgi:hypothetical protein